MYLLKLGSSSCWELAHSLTKFLFSFHQKRSKMTVWLKEMIILEINTLVEKYFSLVETFQPPIRNVQFKVFNANTPNKMAVTIWKSMKQCTRISCRSFLIEATCALGKLWSLTPSSSSKKHYSHSNKQLDKQELLEWYTSCKGSTW